MLPFHLTAGQRQALKDIVEDMQRPQPMNRLLQGDVGAGKTIVALLAALVAMENGLQVAFMAPTEILAEQHFLTISAAAGSDALPRRAAHRQHAGRGAGETLRASSRRAHPSGRRHARARAGRRRVHALGLVVIDEQHRFGVLQRATLRAKGLQPDMLVMTATPIPRTLALTVYGDLDVSVDPRAAARAASRSQRRRGRSRGATRCTPSCGGELEAGRQAYVIYPLVEESEKIDCKRGDRDGRPAARRTSSRSSGSALLHGRMKQDEKDRVMRRIRAGEVHVLVSTTVVEVGVDVPNATVMVVEHAERFGLSQLHQLRGRVGRGAHASYCILLYQSSARPSGRASG